MMSELYGELLDWDEEPGLNNAAFSLDDRDVLGMGDPAKVIFSPKEYAVYLLLDDAKAVKISYADLHMLGEFAKSCERHLDRIGRR